MEQQGNLLNDLNLRKKIFVLEYVKDFNGTQAAIRAGYSAKTANEQAARLLVNVSVKAAIDAEITSRVDRLRIDTDRLVKRWEAQVYADANEIAQHRRHCCRHCWGQDFAYQYTPGEFQRARIKHEDKRAEILGKSGKDIGEFAGVAGDWYNKRLDPNKDCLECFGEGVPEVFLADTRKLSENGKALYEGVKEGRDGIEIKTISKQKAEEYLARSAGVFKDKLEVGGAIAVASPQELEEFFAKKMAESKNMAASVSGRSSRIRELGKQGN